jgi:hypothetical protein
MGQQNDYYRELNIPASAGEQEIKKAFRKLAMLYHPDKNNGSLFAKEKFERIQEAYRVLSDKAQRTAYQYRYFSEKSNQSFLKEINTAEELVIITGKLCQDVADTGPFRVNRELLYFQINHILSDKNLLLLENSTGQTAKQAVIQNICGAAYVLHFSMIKEICGRLKKLIRNDAPALKKLEAFMRETKQAYYWNRYKMLLALLIALLLSAIIYFSN